MNAANANRVTLALCGECARDRGFTVEDETMMSIRPCEGEHRGAAPAATCFATGPDFRPPPPPTAKPLLELVKFAPPTLDAATHCKQAIDLVAAWSTLGDELRIPDEWILGEAVKTVARIHELVASSRK